MFDIELHHVNKRYHLIQNLRKRKDKLARLNQEKERGTYHSKDVLTSFD
jgi:hypothetical protein